MRVLRGEAEVPSGGSGRGRGGRMGSSGADAAPGAQQVGPHTWRWPSSPRRHRQAPGAPSRAPAGGGRRGDGWVGMVRRGPRGGGDWVGTAGRGPVLKPLTCTHCGVNPVAWELGDGGGWGGRELRPRTCPVDAGLQLLSPAARPYAHLSLPHPARDAHSAGSPATPSRAQGAGRTLLCPLLQAQHPPVAPWAQGAPLWRFGEHIGSATPAHWCRESCMRPWGGTALAP